MLYSKCIFVAFLLLSAFNVNADEDIRPDYIKRSEKIIVDTHNEKKDKSVYKDDTGQLLDDAVKATNNSSTGKVYSDKFESNQNNKRPVKLDSFSKNIAKDLRSGDIPTPSLECNSDTNIPSCYDEELNKPKQQVFVFISASMPIEMISDAMDVAAAHNAKLVIRGVRDGMNLKESMDIFSKARTHSKLTPDFAIDPRPFTKFNITSVPAVAVYQYSESLVMLGSLNVDYLIKSFEKGDKGQSKVGSTYQVVEKDFVADLKERASKVDFPSLAKEGVNRYWTHQQYFDIPASKQNASFKIDPTIIVENDVTLADGTILAAAGTKFNPQKSMPLSKIILLFDATDNSQIEFVQKTVKEYFAAGKNYSLIATKFPADFSWEKFQKLRVSLGGKLYQATPDVIQRFKVSSLPTSIAGDGDQLKITQYKVN